jgi:hypothetical protein
MYHEKAGIVQPRGLVTVLQAARHRFQSVWQFQSLQNCDISAEVRIDTAVSHMYLAK